MFQNVIYCTKEKISSDKQEFVHLKATKKTDYIQVENEGPSLNLSLEELYKHKPPKTNVKKRKERLIKSL